VPCAAGREGKKVVTLIDDCEKLTRGGAVDGVSECLIVGQESESAAADAEAACSFIQTEMEDTESVPSTTSSDAGT
jgi:hypothetical protein